MFLNINNPISTFFFFFFTKHNLKRLCLRHTSHWRSCDSAVLSENWTYHSFSLQLCVKLKQEAQKVPVRVNRSPLNDMLDGSTESEMLT